MKPLKPRDRVSAFRLFILEQFPSLTTPPQNAPPATILDVAGGSGTLSWLLLNADNLNSIVLDPRRSDNRRLIRTFEYAAKNPAETAAWSEGYVPGCGQGASLLKLGPPPYRQPKNMRIFMDDDLVEHCKKFFGEEKEKKNNNDNDNDNNNDNDNDNDNEGWERHWKSQNHRAESSQSAHLASLPPSNIPTLDRPRGEYVEDADYLTESGRITDWKEARDTLISASFICGFHPDSAVESAIDLALYMKIPFAVTPCCVFKNLFPERRGEDGEWVRKYVQLVKYLKGKHVNMRSAELDFGQGCEVEEPRPQGARTTTLYMKQEDYYICRDAHVE